MSGLPETGKLLGPQGPRALLGPLTTIHSEVVGEANQPNGKIVLTSGPYSGAAGLVVGVDAWRQLGANSQAEKILQDFQLPHPPQQ